MEGRGNVQRCKVVEAAGAVGVCILAILPRRAQAGSRLEPNFAHVTSSKPTYSDPHDFCTVHRVIVLRR